jgi:hypothetical protein
LGGQLCGGHEGGGDCTNNPKLAEHYKSPWAQIGLGINGEKSPAEAQMWPFCNSPFLFYQAY